MSEVYNVRQLTGAIGAEVIGVDLRQLNSASVSDLWGKLLKFQAILLWDILARPKKTSKIQLTLLKK